MRAQKEASRPTSIDSRLHSGELVVLAEQHGKFAAEPPIAAARGACRDLSVTNNPSLVLP